MPDHSQLPEDSLRLDKWLWYARFYKTRSMAAESIRTGKVQVAGRRVKPSHPIKIGEELSIRKGPYTFRLAIKAMTRNRQSASAAPLLFTEHEESINARELIARELKTAQSMHPGTKGRPTKRERRSIIQFLKDSS